jgi:hypothetical protein
VAIGRSRQPAGELAGVPEQLLDPVPALLHPSQRQPEPGDRVPNHVEGELAGDQDEQLAPGSDGLGA